jgi:EAL domain-containing protein (putative c-di-GMP-specific phosphodiesterase class I)
MVSPANFIPLAEENGLITEIGSWVLERACAQLQQWQQQGLDLRVSVNLSAPQLDDANFCDKVARCLKRYRLDPSQLELELTESIIMKHVDQTIRLLEQLDQMGVHLSVDDFGTGYSSLSYLKRFPLNKLKIDQSFVREICVDPDDATICRTIISMADNLNLTVIAEGVEDADQLAMLAEFGCHQYQGYFFSRPVPAEQIPDLFDNTEQPERWNYQI